MNPSVTKIEDFGTLADGTAVPRYRLDNGRGVSAEVIGLGGILLTLNVPDKDGKSENVLLSPADVTQVLKGKSPYFGALIGRVGNRIANAKFDLDGKTYTLAANNGKATLHGGKVGYDKRLWTMTPVAGDEAAVKLTLIDADGTEGFPGTVNVTVVYTLTKDDAWRIDYTATTDKATPINLTQHAYFNLKDAGHSSVLDHEVKLHADKYTPAGADLVAHGEIADVAGTPLDFRDFKPAGRDFSQMTNKPNGVDHNFVVNGTGLRVAAEVREKTTGRTMTVVSDQPGIQLYTGNFLDGKAAFAGGVKFARHTALCLETQHFPNSPNVPAFPDTILKPGQTYRTTTEYRFGVMK